MTGETDARRAKMVEHLRKSRRRRGLHNVTRDDLPEVFAILGSKGDPPQDVLDKLETIIRNVCEPLAKATPGERGFEKERSLAAQALLEYWFPVADPPRSIKEIRIEHAGNEHLSNFRYHEDRVIDRIVERIVDKGRSKPSPAAGDVNLARFMEFVRWAGSYQAYFFGPLASSVDELRAALSSYPTRTRGADQFSLADRAVLSNSMHMIYQPLFISSKIATLAGAILEKSLLDNMIAVEGSGVFTAEPLPKDLLFVLRKSVILGPRPQVLGEVFNSMQRLPTTSMLQPLKGEAGRIAYMEFRDRLISHRAGREIVQHYAEAVATCMSTRGLASHDQCLIEVAQRNAGIVSGFLGHLRADSKERNIWPGLRKDLPMLALLHPRLLIKSGNLTEIEQNELIRCINQVSVDERGRVRTKASI